MDTKGQIIAAANSLMVERGFNAFSYKHISMQIDIKTSSIHYHFPAKSDLGIAVIRKHKEFLEFTIEKCNEKTPIEKVDKLFKYYKMLVAEQKVCIAGALISDINTLDESIRQELLSYGNTLVNWIASILEEGQRQQLFRPVADHKLKAKLIMASLMGLIQVARIEKKHNSTDQLMQLILNDLMIIR